MFLRKISSGIEIGSTTVDLQRIHNQTKQVDDYLSTTFGPKKSFNIPPKEPLESPILPLTLTVNNYLSLFINYIR